MIPHQFRITELRPISIKGGYLIDGFPSVGYTSAIAAESLIHTTQFELAGFVDSNKFPAVSLVRNGRPNYPTNVYVNNELNVGVFSSYLTLNEPMQKTMAKTMLEWAQKHGVSYVISSAAIKAEITDTVAVGSTDAARAKIKECGMRVLEHGTIPGIPGAMLNRGMTNDQDVIVVLFNPHRAGPDFKSSVDLCTAMAKLVPGATCDIPALQKEAEKIDVVIKETKEETKRLTDGMYQ